jgi:hypothetical protein
LCDFGYCSKDAGSDAVVSGSVAGLDPEGERK